MKPTNIRIMYLALFPLALGVVTVACSPACPNPDTPEARASARTDCPKDEPKDAGPRDANAPLPNTCAGACTNLRERSCPLGQNTPKGSTCEAFCENIQANNAGAGFNISCMVKAKTCAEADACR